MIEKINDLGQRVAKAAPGKVFKRKGSETLYGDILILGNKLTEEGIEVPETINDFDEVDE